MRTTCLVIPCYNEARRLRAEAFMSAVIAEPALHLLFVDDGSVDSTRGALEALCARRPSQMSLLARPQNSGKAEAVRAGVLAACGQDYELIGYWDADLATPLDAVFRFAPLFDLSQVQLVMGSRVKLLGRHIERKAARHYLGRVFATAASTVLGIAVYDTQCGAKLFRVGDEVRAIFAAPFRVTWTFDVELLARMKLYRLAYGSPPIEDCTIEYPLEDWVDVEGSKVRPSDFLVGMVELARIWRLLRAARR